MRAERFIYFVLRITTGPRVKFVDSKSALTPRSLPGSLCYRPSKVVVLLLFLRFVWLCGFYYWPFHVESCLALCSQFFSPI